MKRLVQMNKQTNLDEYFWFCFFFGVVKEMIGELIGFHFRGLDGVL